MKRKFITALLLAVALAVMMLSVTACRDKNDDYDDPQPENGVDHQFEDGVIIPPDATREVDHQFEDEVTIPPNSERIIEDQQSFEVDLESGEHSFSIGEIIDEPEEDE